MIAIRKLYRWLMFNWKFWTAPVFIGWDPGAKDYSARLEFKKVDGVIYLVSEKISEEK